MYSACKYLSRERTADMTVLMLFLFLLLLQVQVHIPTFITLQELCPKLEKYILRGITGEPGQTRGGGGGGDGGPEANRIGEFKVIKTVKKITEKGSWPHSFRRSVAAEEDASCTWSPLIALQKRRLNKIWGETWRWPRWRLTKSSWR